MQRYIARTIPSRLQRCATFGASPARLTVPVTSELWFGSLHTHCSANHISWVYTPSGSLRSRTLPFAHHDGDTNGRGEGEFDVFEMIAKVMLVMVVVMVVMVMVMVMLMT